MKIESWKMENQAFMEFKYLKNQLASYMVLQLHDLPLFCKVARDLTSQMPLWAQG